MKVVVDGWAWLPKTELSGEQLMRLKDRLTVQPIRTAEEQKEDPEPIPLYEDRDGRLGVPRYFFYDNRRPVHQVEEDMSYGSDLWKPAEFSGELRPEQSVALKETVTRLQASSGGIIQAKPGWGKCLGLGTPVLKYDGSVVPVEEVAEGDLLMGPDGQPRRVLSTCRGEGNLYRIVPNLGDPWVCNDVHVLTLVHSITGEVQDMEIGRYLELPASKKRYWKQFAPAEGVDFEDPVPVPLDPYFMGVWFGDGNKALRSVAVSKPDAEILALCEEVAKQYGCRVRTEWSGSCPTHHIVSDTSHNRLLTRMREVVGEAQEFPRCCLTASRADRRAFLAGLLDADGHNNGGCLRIVQKRKAYAEGAAFVARSLGIRATVRYKPVNGEDYWRVNLAGDFSRLPMRLARKYPGERRQKKVATRTGFAVEPLGHGEYAGFALSGDGRFLLGDFTVTHNTVVALAIAAELRVPTLVVVHKTFLMDQWKERIEAFLPGAEIGRIQQDKCDFRGKTIVMGMVHSLGGQDYPPELYEWPGLVIVDECHRIGARTWAPVPPRFKARYRLGFTATPRRKDRADDVFFQHIGPIIFVGKEQRLAPKVKRVWTKFKLVKTDRFNPNLANRTLLLRFLCASRHRNDLIVDQIIAAVSKGRKCLVLSERLNHLERLEQRLEDLWPDEYGESPTTGHYVGGRSKRQLEVASEAQVIFATSQYAQEGLDIPALDTLFLTTPMSDIEQAVGRIQRPRPGKKEPIVVDFRDDSVPMFEAQAKKRDRIYDRIS